LMVAPLDEVRSARTSVLADYGAGHAADEGRQRSMIWVTEAAVGALGEGVAHAGGHVDVLREQLEHAAARGALALDVARLLAGLGEAVEDVRGFGVRGRVGAEDDDRVRCTARGQKRVADAVELLLVGLVRVG